MGTNNQERLITKKMKQHFPMRISVKEKSKKNTKGQSEREKLLRVIFSSYFLCCIFSSKHFISKDLQIVAELLHKF